MATVVSPTMLALICFVLLSSSLTSSHPIAADKCRTGCQGVTPNHFKYAEGTTYKYNLESTADISLSSAEGQQSTTKVKATVLLTQQAQCVQVLRLQNVQIFGGDGKKKGTIPNIEKAIKLNFHDGHIEDVICAEHGDTQVSLNMKRAVASLFQAALKDNVETDVFGACPTSFATSKDGNVVTYTKSRSLNRCSQRENAKHDFISTAFNMDSEFKSAPVLRADYISEMRVKDGLLDHVLVTENYLYMPFSIGKNGAKASIQTKLQLTGKAKDAAKNKCAEPRSIIFENPHPVVSEKSDVKTIVDAIKETAHSIKETVGERTASKFGQLITVMAAGKKDDLLAVYNQVQSGAGFHDKEKAKKVFLDALFRAGTGDCLEVSIQLLKSKQLSPMEEKMVYLGMSFIRHATPESIATAASLLDTPKLSREAYLGIGALVSHYCRAHDCHNLEQMKALSGKLVAKLKDGKCANRDQENEMIAALKALTNMKHLADSVVPKVVAIAQDKKNPMRLRVAALEAYGSDMCKDKLRDSALAILKDIQQDAEIRIKAYLALTECPTAKIATAINAMLDTEQSYHILGFIVSHIRNLRSSANPDKEMAQEILSGINTKRTFPMDPRKYSYFDEVSHAINTLGTSGSVDTSVIYSQSSFLPRSVGVNLTAEIFGHRVNFLEMETRQENLDKLMEHYLGPLGVLRNKNPDDLMAAGKASLEKIMAHLQERMVKTRGKRHVPQAEIDSMGKAVQIKTHELNADLDLDLSVKIFGSEFLFLTLNRSPDELSADKLIDKLFDCLDQGIDQAKNYQHTFTRNGIFMDMELAYPTSTGFPLKMSVEGIDSMQLTAETKVDVRALLQGKQSVMQLKLIPSANIEIAGRLTLDAAVVESGLKVASTLHTATGSALTLEVFPAGVDAKLSLPIEKQEIVSAEHQLVFVTREAGHCETETPLKFVESKPLDVCLDHLESVVGLTFCAGLNSPNPQLNQGNYLPFPFNGNSQLKVFVTREKPVTYHIRDVVYDEHKKGFEFMLETLDDAKRPMVSLAVEGFLRPEMYVKAALDSPIKKAELEGRLVYTLDERSVGAKFVHDNQEYSGKLGVTVTGGPDKSTYKPVIEFVTPEQGKQKSPYTVEGQIIAEEGPTSLKLTFDHVKLIAPNMPAIEITGNLGNEDHAYFADLKVDDGSNSGTFKGKLDVSKNKIKVDAKVMNTLSPVSNFLLDYELTNADNTFTSDLSLTHGGDLTDKHNCLKLKNSVTDRFTDSADYQYETKNEFSYPLIGAEGTFHVNKVPKAIDFVAEGMYQKAKAGTKLHAKYNQKQAGDYDVVLDAVALENKLKVKAKRDINGDVSTIDHCLEVNAKKAEVKGTVTHRVNPYDIKVGCDLAIQVPQCPETITVKHAYTHVPDECKTNLKINKGAECLVDMDLNVHKVNGGKGHLKAHITDVVNVEGALNADKWNGKAHLIVDAVKADRKIKLDSTFNLADPTYNFAANFYPNFEKSPQKICLNSENQLTETSVDSKNKLDIFENTFEGNLKTSCEGDIKNGKVALEGDLTLPSSMYFAAKFNREMKTVDEKSSGNVFLNLEQRNNKNAPGRKLTIKGVGKDINLEESKIDVAYTLSADDSNGKNLHGDLAIKWDESNDVEKGEIKGKLYGSVLAEPVEFSHKELSTEHDGSYETSYKCAHGSLDLGGKYHFKDEHKLAAEVKADLKTTNPKLKHAKFATAGKLHMDDDKFEFGGSTKLFVDDDGTDPDATVDFEAEGDMSASEHDGHVKGTIKVQKMDPITAAVGYGHKEDNGVMKCQADASLKYAEGKTIKADATLVRPNNNEGKLELNLETPFETMKKSEIVMNYKQSEDERHTTSDLTAVVDGKKAVLKSELRLSETKPLFMVELEHYDHKDVILLASEQLGDNKYKGQMVLAYQKYNIDYVYDIEAPSIDDFCIKATLKAPALIEPDEIHYEIKNKKNNAIEVAITSGDLVLVKGTATYKLRDEPGKYIVEGSGEFTVKNDKQTGNFKFISQQLTQDKNHEIGSAVTLDITLGKHAMDAEAKITNKQFRIMNSYCQEKNNCQHFEIDSKSNVVSMLEYDNEVEVRIELASYDFGLKTVCKRKHLQFDHTTDVHFQTNDNKKYQFSQYLHPKEAGVSLTTPKRQVALEGKIDVPAKGKGPAMMDICFYLDKKNEPGKKTSWTSVLDVSGTDKAGKIAAETKFSSPGLSKPLTLTYASKHDVAATAAEMTIVVDIFANPSNKIVFAGKSAIKKAGENGQYDMVHHATLKSVGMGIDMTYDEVTYSLDTQAHTFKTMAKLAMNMNSHKCTCMYLFEVSPTNLLAKVQLHDKQLLVVDSKMKFSKEAQVVDTDITIIGAAPMSSHYELKNFNAMKYTLQRKQAGGHPLTVNAAVIPGQIADVRADIGSQELFKASLQLDEANFLKPDYGLNLDNVQKLLLQPAKAQVDAVLKESQALLQDTAHATKETAHHVAELSRNNMPNLKGVKDYYAGEWSKLAAEIHADPNIQKACEVAQQVFGAVIHAFSDICAKALDLVEKICNTIKAAAEKVVDVICNQVWPQVKATVEGFAAALKSIFDSACDIVFGLLARVNQFLEAHQAELKQIATTLSTLSQDVGRFLSRNYERMRGLLFENCYKLYEELKALPIYEELMARYELLVKDFGDWSEPLTHMLDDALNTLQDIVPNEDAKHIVEAFRTYLDKKMKNEPVDDIATLENILKSIVNLVRKLTSQYKLAEVPAVDSKDLLTDSLFALPKLVASKFSPLEYLIQDDDLWDNVDESLYGFSLNPRSWLGPPFRMYGYLVQGQHVFTFDGKHMTFPGACNYLIARDALHGNFTVAGTFAGGHLAAVTVTEGKESVTIKKGGQVMHGKAAADFPLKVGHLKAYRSMSRMHVHGKSGVEVTCDPKMVVCKVSVSGFYHGQVRGLLGNGNNEAYDDFTIASGKIVSGEAEFGNSYKMTAACKPVTTVDHSKHEHNDACTKLFTDEDNFEVCYPFVNAELYRTACDHGMAAGIKDTEEALARGYVEACNAKYIPAILPTKYMRCTNGDQEHSVGESFSVKLPGKAADVVLVVDQAKGNEQAYKDLVQPVVAELTKELAAKGINDVEFHLIGYDNHGPSHFTNAGKLAWKGKLPAMKFTEPAKDERWAIGLDSIDPLLAALHEVKEEVVLTLGLDAKAMAFYSSYRYPFRAHATKTIVAFNTEACQEGKLVILQKLRSLLFSDDEIHINLVAPIEDFKVKDAKVSKSVVGFDDKHVMTFADAKKKSEGSTELHKELDVDDYCSEFIVDNGGAVFNMDNFNAAKGPQRAQFAQLVAQTLAKQVTNTEQRLDCECAIRGLDSARNVCESVEQNHKE